MYNPGYLEYFVAVTSGNWTLLISPQMAEFSYGLYQALLDFFQERAVFFSALQLENFFGFLFGLTMIRRVEQRRKI